jgi:hypothetical protein
VNDRRWDALLADLASLVRVDDSTRFAATPVPAVRTAELRLQEWAALGHKSGGESGGRSSEVSDPTFRAATRSSGYERERDDFFNSLAVLELHARKLARIVDRTRPVPALADTPDSPCGNVACEHVCEGTTTDRIIRPKGSDIGVCGRCRKHFERHGRHWPTKADGRDVRLGAA